MALTRVRPQATSARWSCSRCYTVNAAGTQFCSDCGVTPRPGSALAAAPTIHSSSRRLVVVPILLVAVTALGLVGLQLVR